jgi:RNA polymerase sigma factor (sigma-70 family)
MLARRAAPTSPASPEGTTTLAVQRCLDAMVGDAAAPHEVRELLERSVRRLRLLCARLLYRSYPRLTRPPLGLRPEEMLSAVVERLLRALAAIRPGTVRQFFALANQHMRWELNDLARKLDEQPLRQPLLDVFIAPVRGSASQPTPRSRLLIRAIEGLPLEEREVFDLVKIQGLSIAEVAQVLGVSTKTVQRRIQRSRLLLAEALHDLDRVVGRGAT